MIPIPTKMNHLIVDAKEMAPVKACKLIVTELSKATVCSVIDSNGFLLIKKAGQLTHTGSENN